MPALTVSGVLLALNIVVELLGAEEVQERLGDLGNLKGQRLEDAWEEMSSMVASAARDKVSDDVYWQGDLLGSIDHAVVIDGDEISSIIFADVAHAPFQERGTPPATAGGDRSLLEGIEPWALDKGYSPFAVARAIATRGVEAKWFFRDTLVELEDDIVAMVGQVITEIMEREY